MMHRGWFIAGYAIRGENAQNQQEVIFALIQPRDMSALKNATLYSISITVTSVSWFTLASLDTC